MDLLDLEEYFRKKEEIRGKLEKLTRWRAEFTRMMELLADFEGKKKPVPEVSQDEQDQEPHAEYMDYVDDDEEEFNEDEFADLQDEECDED